jgi:hypothetical protein
LIGGADHKTGHGDPAEALRNLEEYARSRFRVQAFHQQWSAEFFEPADGVPFIGKAPTLKNTYVATGFSGTGLTYGAAAGMLLADLVQGLQPAWAAVVSPSRFKPMAAAKELIKENVDVATRFVADRFGGEKIDSLAEIAAGEGRLVSYEGEQLAVYRDEMGRFMRARPSAPTPDVTCIGTAWRRRGIAPATAGASPPRESAFTGRRRMIWKTRRR